MNKYPWGQNLSSWDLIFDNFPPSAIFPAFGDFSRLRRVCAPKRAQSSNFVKLSKAKLSFAPKRAKLRANAQKRRPRRPAPGARRPAPGALVKNICFF